MNLNRLTLLIFMTLNIAGSEKSPSTIVNESLLDLISTFGALKFEALDCDNLAIQGCSLKIKSINSSYVKFKRSLEHAITKNENDILLKGYIRNWRDHNTSHKGILESATLFLGAQLKTLGNKNVELRLDGNNNFQQTKDLINLYAKNAGALFCQAREAQEHIKDIEKLLEKHHLP